MKDLKIYTLLALLLMTGGGDASARVFTYRPERK